MSDLFIFGFSSASTPKIDLSSATITLGPSLTYNGNEQTQSVTSVVVKGTTLVENTDYTVTDNTGINASDYTLSVVGMGNYTGTATQAWSIAKANGSVSLSPTSLSLDASNLVGAISVTRSGNGTVTAQSSNTGIATTSVETQLYLSTATNNVRTGPATTYDILGKLTNGATYIYLGEQSGTWYKIVFNGEVAWASSSSGSAGHLIDNENGATVVVTAVASGSTTVTVNVAAGTNHLATSGMVSVSVLIVSSTLADNSPATIQAVAQAGTGSQYWSVGAVTAPITISAISSLPNFTPQTEGVCAFIIGFNHNSSREGTGIHFQFGKTSSGTDIAFVDSGYNSDKDSGTWFNINNSQTNSGGWKSSRMRSTICPAFLNALPTAWKNVITATKKYTDNTGGGSSSSVTCTATSDKIWLLSQYEVFASTSGVTSTESTYCVQYDYYKNGNSTIKYRHNATTTQCVWWLRSPYANSSIQFCCVNGGYKSYSNTYVSRGFAPGFRIA